MTARNSWSGPNPTRPCLGYNLDSAQEIIEAGKMVAQIQGGSLRQTPTPMGRMTLESFTAAYLAELKERGVVDLVRPERVLDTYLVPAFPQPMRSITYQQGQVSIAARRTAGAADGTIGREWTILLSVLNFAVKVGELTANPLQGVMPPTSGARDRMPTSAEIARIATVATERLQRAATVALCCGLREEKVWAIRPSWIVQKPDGPWLQLPPPRSKKKGNPTLLSLNRFAYAALMADPGSSDNVQIFHERADKHALGKAWSRATATAEVKSLRFHDLRRWFSSTLEDMGAERRKRRSRGKSWSICLAINRQTPWSDTISSDRRAG